MTTANQPSEILAFPDSYVILDLETTGLSKETDYIIEIAGLKVDNLKIIEQFQTLIACPVPLNEHINALCGITDEMLLDACDFSSIADKLRDFIGDKVIVGHSVLFDIDFLSRYFSEQKMAPLNNSYIDTLPLSQKLLPELIHHRLKDIASYYQYSTETAHRALSDCIMNQQIFEAMKQTIIKTYGSYDEFIARWDTLSKHLKAETIVPATTDFDPTHPLYHKNCVITGALDRLSRKEAMQAIADAGGFNMDKLNTFTDLLILGNGSYCDLLTGVTKKHKKALRLINEGYPIRILSEEEFYQILFS